MKRVWKISETAHSELPLLKPKPKTLFSITPFIITHNTFTKTPINRLFFADHYCSQPNINSNPFPKITGLFENRGCNVDIQELVHEVSLLRDELIRVSKYGRNVIFRVLDEKGSSLFRDYGNGDAFVELVKQLERWPRCALQVCKWRRKQANDDLRFSMTSEEYAKSIRIAGRLRDIDLAIELFTEAANKRIKTATTYNALMGAYMYNKYTDTCQLLFREFKMDQSCRPTVVTYNILLSVFGQLTLIDQMETTLQEMKNLNILPNLTTYNMILSGYVTAWMWESMEETYVVMEASGIKPDVNTHMLMLRGYAYSGDLKKMEEFFELVYDHVIEHKEFTLIRAMICAYCKSTSRNRVKRVEELLGLIPKNDYQPWLNAILIKLYAQENIMDVMESYIEEAFKRSTSITTADVMRSILASYFRANAVDKLANFVKRAEYAGWKICRSVYHSKMVMYSSHKRLSEMESVLDEMENFNIQPTGKTFSILYKAYLECGQKRKLDQVLGVMCTRGFGTPSNTMKL
ncbi:pentatricopeptide repeat-containing protein At2g30780-like [Apium graveolens]|uniref:pentatricopeptide repeat-containing protein At2g30780-like n=1 Tax=Apium graveolens TaxID=4045 RepID=UPI003D7B10F1